MKLTKKQKILIVDDVPGNIKVLAEILKDDYQVLMTTNGKDALKGVVSEDVSLVLLDVIMPEMDGFEVCRKLKADELTREIPVVFVTGKTSEADIAHGLKLGAHYYLTKPFKRNIILAVVASVMSSLATRMILKEKIRKASTISRLCHEGSFSFRTMDEAMSVVAFLANTCPDPNKVSLGLQELFFNSIEHGNLGITYEDKTRLLEANIWGVEVIRRLALPENAFKRVFVRYERMEDEIHFLIRDQGPGFDWKPYLQPNPARAFDSHGRGIVVAKTTSFDRLEYRGSGNEVLGIVKISP